MEIFKDIRLPVIAAPMFLVSGPELVSAACRAGLPAAFPALNQRTTEGFEEWVAKIQGDLRSQPGAAPFGVNLIVHKTNPRVEPDLRVCVKHKVPFVITSLGAVADLVNAVHSYGGVVFHDVTNVKHARKAAEAGVDGLILVAAGAGGHAGTMNPFALVSEVRKFFNKTLILAGAISTGRDIAAARMMGADFAYMGTRFIATQESRAQVEYKKMLEASAASDIVYTPAVSGIPANFLRASLESNGFNIEQLLGGGAHAGAKVSLQDEAKAWKTVWSAGHGVGGIYDTPSAFDLIQRLETEYQQAIKQFCSTSHES
jgi:nitronate monooxygenase